MYGQGSSTPQVLAACTGVAGAVCGATILPQTGVDTAVQLAIATVCGLAAWAIVYMGVAKYGKR